MSEKKPKLSVVILTKDSQDSIVDAVDSIKELADEIIVVDSNSVDRTEELAKRAGARVITHDFKDFSSQRNFAMGKTTGEWVLYIDSDEQATPEFNNEVKEVLKMHTGEHSKIGGYFVKRKTFYYGKDWGLTDKMQRLFLKSKFDTWHGTVHETAKIHGEYGTIISPIQHFTHSDIAKMIEKTNEWSEHEALLRFKAGHPKMNVIRFVRVMLTGFYESYVGNKGYKNGVYGIIEASYQAFSIFVTYAKLWEKQQKTRDV